jgi:tripartite-type tricarboxylate transporter receptor subunit TctC
MSRLTRRQTVTGIASAVAAAPLVHAPAFAQSSYPNRPVKVIVPFAAAGPSDLIARIIAEAVGPKLGQNLVIENRPGGGANIGIGLAARAEPDGYTLLITTSAIAINPSLYKKVSFDPFKDFVPIADLAVSPQTLSVKTGFAKTLAEVIAKAKAEPGKLNYSSPGVGTQSQLTVELLKIRAGIDMVHIPFSGGPSAAQAIVNGTAQFGVNALPSSEGLIQGGLIHAVAISSEKRWPTLPDVPTLVEAGFPGFVSETFAGLFAPAGTPREIVDLLAREVMAALKSPEVGERARKAGFLVVGAGPESLARRVAEQYATNREVIQKSGIPLR